MTLIYIRCVNCAQEFEGEPKFTFKKYDGHLASCKPIREIWCWHTLRASILARDNYSCTDCGSKENLEVHHIQPLIEGGSNTPDNLITLCKKCHRKRTDQLLRQRLKEVRKPFEEEVVE